ncbi:DNA replication/repair protein RecF [Hugenholtzia roseola]|uniref:DNA replication/repair protein RecF n=1 Tax=Hugenholtzia roseola TaxID=1002 RepID=UPI00041FDAF3|nr:DNA replication and repair protein RecF [Hugenholtzia roseola]
MNFDESSEKNIQTLWLKEIHLHNFKSYEEKKYAFSSKINCIVGENGVGKTNLLDAIHYLCIGKSAFLGTESQQIRQGANFFALKGKFEQEKREEVVLCSLEKGKKKELKLNKIPYKKISEHVGKLPCVLLQPQDTDLIRESSEFRRSFFDNLLSQTSQPYLQALILYQHTLKQRNSLLKQCHELGKKVDKNLIKIYDSILVEKGNFIFEMRRKMIQKFNVFFQKYYQDLAQEKEAVSLEYRSELDKEPLAQLLKDSQADDLRLLRTTKGVHKDDYVFLLHTKSLKIYGSQGQQKTFVIALQFAKSDYLYAEKNCPPLLLLDDIFDKLDDSRIEKLAEILHQERMGQAFISDARPERSQAIFQTGHFISIPS